MEEQVQSPGPTDPCPRCEPLEGSPGMEEWEGTPCPTCGRPLPLPKGLPGGTVLTMLLFLKVLGESITDVWQTAREAIEDERLRTHLLLPIDPETPDAYVSLNQVDVPDPVTPAVLRVIEEEGVAGSSVVMRRLLFALEKRRVMLTTILRETFGAGFQRDDARVAARLGFRVSTVHRAVHGKRLVRV